MGRIYQCSQNYLIRKAYNLNFEKNNKQNIMEYYHTWMKQYNRIKNAMIRSKLSMYPIVIIFLLGLHKIGCNTDIFNC